MKLSIITINLNNKDGLQKTIDSVVTQTFRDFEWIVIDGGSTDGSKELIEQYADYFAYWVSEPDKGIYNAMNKGINEAKGEYLQFLNSGDWLFDSNILSTIPFGTKADIIYGKCLVHDLSGEVFEYGPHYTEFTPFSLVNATIAHPASFIKKNVMIAIGGFDESFKIAADLDFFFNAIICNKATTIYINHNIVHFAGGGISMTNTEQTEQEKRNVIAKYLLEGSVTDFNCYTSMLQSKIQVDEKQRGVEVYEHLYQYWMTRKIMHFLYRIVK